MPTDAQRRNLASAHHAEVMELKERIALLEQQLAEARKDVERLNFLDAQNETLEDDAWVVLAHDCTAEEDWKKYWVGADLRGAIDAAITRTQETS